MRVERVNRVSVALLLLLSLTALVTVVNGLLQAPRPLPQDEGTAAHIFQLSIAALLPVGLLFITTADWRQPGRVARLLLLPAVATVLAFVLLYYLEHLR